MPNTIAMIVPVPSVSPLLAESADAGSVRRTIPPVESVLVMTRSEGSILVIITPCASVVVITGLVSELVRVVCGASSSSERVRDPGLDVGEVWEDGEGGSFEDGVG